jgi:hypothetical protein
MGLLGAKTEIPAYRYQPASGEDSDVGGVALEPVLGIPGWISSLEK